MTPSLYIWINVLRNKRKELQVSMFNCDIWPTKPMLVTIRLDRLINCLKFINVLWIYLTLNVRTTYSYWMNDCFAMFHTNGTKCRRLEMPQTTFDNHNNWLYHAPIKDWPKVEKLRQINICFYYHFLCHNHCQCHRHFCVSFIAVGNLKTTMAGFMDLDGYKNGKNISNVCIILRPNLKQRKGLHFRLADDTVARIRWVQIYFWIIEW